jgi:O-methyltransferase
MFYQPLSAAQFERLHRALSDISDLFGEDTFYGDHLITVGRSMGFLADAKFTGAVAAECRTMSERAMIWRMHVLAWAADHAKGIAGDFVECGVYQALSTRILASYLNFAAIEKSWLLYDLFENAGGAGQGVAMPEHSPHLYQKVCDSLSAYPNIIVIRGRVPESFLQRVPEAIAFLHLDLNDAEAERAALAELFARLTPGGLVVLDDYGWRAHQAQHDGADAFFSAVDHRVLELPTGQGLVIKR